MKELLHIAHEKTIFKSKRMSIEFTNPKNIDRAKPFIYYIEITSNKNIKYTYIGKASSKSRPNAYNRSIKRIIEYKCNMNEGASWYVEEFERKSALIK